jgi:hypothetical protein
MSNKDFYDATEATDLISTALPGSKNDRVAATHDLLARFVDLNSLGITIEFDRMAQQHRIWHPDGKTFATVAPDADFTSLIVAKGDNKTTVPIVFDSRRKVWVGREADRFFEPAPTQSRQHRSALAVLVEAALTILGVKVWKL